MTWAAIVLIGMGVADLLRAPGSSRGRVGAHLLAPVTILATAALSGVFAVADVIALLLASVGVAAWIELSSRTQSTGRGALPALAVLAATLAGVVAFSGLSSATNGLLTHWLAWADLPGAHPIGTPRVLLLLGLVLFNIATGNVIVRLVLLAIGALRPDQLTAGQAQPAQPSDRLKGGRLLGPMERLVILGLGLAGELGAAGIVIAAKGLLRFPEIQAAGRTTSPTGTGIDDVTEYFLVGSFVSWLVALASLGVAVL